MEDQQDMHAAPRTAPPVQPGALGYGGSDIPGARLSLVLGILSIILPMTCFLSFAGVVLGLIGLRTGMQARAKAREGAGNSGSKGIAEAGFICSVIGLVLSVLGTFASIVYAAVMVIAIMNEI